MSKEKQCESCQEWWYSSDVKEDLCPNCYAYWFNEKNTFLTEQEAQAKLQELRGGE